MDFALRAAPARAGYAPICSRQIGARSFPGARPFGTRASRGPNLLPANWSNRGFEPNTPSPPDIKKPGLAGFFYVWRRGRDSNPRNELTFTRFPGARLRPLGHLSSNFCPWHQALLPTGLDQGRGEGGIARSIHGPRPSDSADLRRLRAHLLPANGSNPRNELTFTRFPGARVAHLILRCALRAPPA